jgi:hypothetical protein
MNRNLPDLTSSELIEKIFSLLQGETECPDDPENGYWLLNDEIKTPIGLK